MKQQLMMEINIKKYSILFFILIFGQFSIAQELIKPLTSNKKLIENKIPFKTYRALADTFDLDKYPFWDDFTGDSPYPKDTFWVDNYVFINNSLAFRPISVNTASFDGLDSLGIPYNPGVVNSKGKRADKLTSVCIDLSKYNQKDDSLYLSFFYQPAGLGEAPEEYDSLVLEFKADSVWNGSVWEKDKWIWIWSAAGSKVKLFEQVILPIKQYVYDTNLSADPIGNIFHNGFQFRFENYGNLAGNMDLWHLDYVYLDKGRSWDDTYFKDMAIFEKPISLLQNYVSMPFDHFNNDKTYLRNKLEISARKLNKTPLNLIARCQIIDLVDGDILLTGADDKTIYGSDTTMPLVFTVRDDLQLNKIVSADTVELETTLSSNLIDDWKINDETKGIQGFYNYYAYDDGVPEFGYGVYPGKYGMVAYKFTVPENLPAGDSLRGVYIYFNLSDELIANAAFNIAVWNDGNYESTPIMFSTRVPGLDYINGNGYVLFYFDTGIGINSEFYIGWEQNSEFYMNVGLDMNYYQILGDSSPIQKNSNLFYYANSKWSSSSAKGALMIRPVISDKLERPVSIKEKQYLDLSYYPNPADQFIHIKGLEQSSYTFHLFDISGKEVYVSDVSGNSQVDISSVAEGFYLIQLIDEKKGLKYNSKILIR